MDYTGKTVLLTGAGGFIGSHLTEELVTCGASGSRFSALQFARRRRKPQVPCVRNLSQDRLGMITTSDPELARRLRSVRSHGMTVSSWDRDKGRPSQHDVLEFGFNFRFDDIRAALGLAQLEKLSLFNGRRAELVHRYNNGFSKAAPRVISPFGRLAEKKHPAYHIYPIVLSGRRERDATADALKAAGVQTSIHYCPIHHFSAFRQTGQTVDLPRTDEFAASELTLPLYPSLDMNQVDMIVSMVLRTVL